MCLQLSVFVFLYVHEQEKSVIMLFSFMEIFVLWVIFLVEIILNHNDIPFLINS